MKKLAFLMAVMMMFTLLLAGCNNTTTPSAPESTPTESGGTESTPADGDNPYAGIDLSKEENIVMYVTATEPNAMAKKRNTPANPVKRIEEDTHEKTGFFDGGYDDVHPAAGRL